MFPNLGVSSQGRKMKMNDVKHTKRIDENRRKIRFLQFFIDLILKRWQFQLFKLRGFFSYPTIGFCPYSWYVARKGCSRSTYKGVRMIDAEKGEKLLVTPCRNHGCNCKKIENRLLLVQNVHGYIGHIYEENLGRECENPHAKRRKSDYEMEELKVRVLSRFFDRVRNETTYRISAYSFR